MLPSKERLNRKQFTELLNKRPLVVYNSLGTLKYLSSPDKLLSVVISSKYIKSAVLRNKIRRQVYTLFQKTNQNLNGILYLSKQSSTYSYGTLQKLFSELLQKASNSAK